MSTDAITRVDLYVRVWPTLRSRLASLLGLCGKGLRDNCQRRDVPIPARRYPIEQGLFSNCPYSLHSKKFHSGEYSLESTYSLNSK